MIFAGSAPIDFAVDQVAGERIEYDKLGSRPIRFGGMPLEYDMLGSRLIRVGDLAVEYDMAGSRVRRLGDLTVDYDRLGSRPRYLTAASETAFGADRCVVAFLVLVAFRPDD